jgi:hypothetical protein
LPNALVDVTTRWDLLDLGSDLVAGRPLPVSDLSRKAAAIAWKIVEQRAYGLAHGAEIVNNLAPVEVFQRLKSEASVPLAKNLAFGSKTSTLIAPADPERIG